MIPFETVFNILIIIVFLIYWGAVFVIIYHLTRFGVGTLPKRLAAIFLLGSVIISTVAIITYTSVDVTTLLPK